MPLGSLDIRRLFSVPAIYDSFQDLVGANALKKRFLETWVPSARPLRLLEIGCGPGKNLDYLPRDIQYVGCDLSAKYIEHARKKYGDIAEFHCLSVADLGKLHLDPFDVILSMGVLHHLSNDLVRGFCQEMTQVLKKDGLFLALEPCWTPSQSWINRTIMSHDRGEDIRYMDGYCDLLKRTFSSAEANEVETKDIILFPTAACAIQASGPKI
jgi:SAM-dependent methyltransferase